MLVPDSLATRLRAATYDDVMKAVEGANPHGRKELALAFPEMFDATHSRMAENSEAHQESQPAPAGTTDRENDESQEEEAWIAGERVKIIEYLATHRVDHLGVGEWPAFHIDPYLAVWAIQSKKSPGDVGWWAISGDVPTDYMSGSDANHPREVLSYFSRQWAEVSEFMGRGEAHPDSKIGRKEDWSALGPLLKSRSTLLGNFAADDGLWAEEETESEW